MRRKRENQKILDCTIRDGGLVNKWDFSVSFVQELYHALSCAGVDYMEVGYKNSPLLVNDPDAGPWRFLDEAFLKQVIPVKTDTKLSALVDIGRVDPDDILPREDSSLDLIRVACYLHEIDEAIDLVHQFHHKGYETSLNIMAISQAAEDELIEGLKRINRSPVDIVYVVDSFGSLGNTDIEQLTEVFQCYLPTKHIGIHAHNNMQLAFSNTVAGANWGATFLDASVYGMGRAAGNCPTELLVSYLKDLGYDVRPIVDVIERLFIPLRNKVEWGYLIPYAITGIYNEHPRSAIALRNSEDKEKYLAFYDQITSPKSPEKEKIMSTKN